MKKKFIAYSIEQVSMKDPDPRVYQSVQLYEDLGQAIARYNDNHDCMYWVLVGIEEYHGWGRTFEENMKRVLALGVKFPFDGVVGGLEPPKPVGPRKPEPALPLEVWHTKEFDPEVAMTAMRLLCKGA